MFKLSIITPRGIIFEGKIDSLAARGLEGGFEVYSAHAAMLVAVDKGKLRVNSAHQHQVFDTASGVLEVNLEHDVVLLVDDAQLCSKGSQPTQ